ncbi:hypothetical protein [Saccharopolyspora griseoalba]|uniref:Uncharacterized protein n=1 Tax=Saccharopolyspora griseoalba TaxID=1431848 RepID=A0ABW2LJM3_9PSEU
MTDDELELLITVVLGAEDETSARTACADLLDRVGGEPVNAADCSDEEPGCWSVTIAGRTGETGRHPAALSRAVRGLLRELGPGFARQRVSCAPPTAWTVVDEPDLVAELVPGGERLLVEAWLDDALDLPLLGAGNNAHTATEIAHPDPHKST